jgi:hypothetical protein
MTLLGQAADDAGLPDDPEFRAAIIGYGEWGSHRAVGNSAPVSMSSSTRRCCAGAGASRRPISPSSARATARACST